MDNLVEFEVQTISSLEVAEMIGKEHKNLMRDIRRYCVQMNEANEEVIGELKIEPSSKLYLIPTDFFIESTYQNRQNKTQSCYLVTKKGCEFIAHKMTGVKGTAFTARYINRFHDMEQTIKAQQTKKQEQPQLPQKHEWLVEHEDDFRWICRAFNFTRKQLYHQILLEIDKKYNMDEYKILYKSQVGHAAEYIMEVVAYFENLREEAEKVIFMYIEIKMIEANKKNFALEW